MASPQLGERDGDVQESDGPGPRVDPRFPLARRRVDVRQAGTVLDVPTGEQQCEESDDAEIDFGQFVTKAGAEAVEGE